MITDWLMFNVNFSYIMEFLLQLERFWQLQTDNCKIFIYILISITWAILEWNCLKWLFSDTSYKQFSLQYSYIAKYKFGIGPSKQNFFPCGNFISHAISWVFLNFKKSECIHGLVAIFDFLSVTKTIDT